MIVIDYQDRRPLYEQITERFKTLIIRGVLPPESQMPSVRSLAMELSINPNTIQRAYAELERQGYIYPVRGRGNFVSPQRQVMDGRKQEYLTSLNRLLSEGQEMGFSREEILARIDEIWKEKP